MTVNCHSGTQENLNVEKHGFIFHMIELSKPSHLKKKLLVHTTTVSYVD